MSLKKIIAQKLFKKFMFNDRRDFWQYLCLSGYVLITIFVLETLQKLKDAVSKLLKIFYCNPWYLTGFATQFKK